MKEYQMHVFAAYKAGGETYHDCLETQYATAKTAAEAKRIVKAELKKQGYFEIEFSEVMPC